MSNYTDISEQMSAVACEGLRERERVVYSRVICQAVSEGGGGDRAREICKRTSLRDKTHPLKACI